MVVRSERIEDAVSLGRGQATEIELIVIAEEMGPLTGERDGAVARSESRSGRALRSQAPGRDAG